MENGWNLVNLYTRKMTALFDQSSRTIGNLIQSCGDSERSFRDAAHALTDSNLKQLFGLYAQQRERFAIELRGLTILEVRAAALQESSSLTQRELLSDCLRREIFLIDLYRQAIAGRTLPTRAHFLVSAQLALLEKVHSRIQTLTPSLHMLQGDRIAL